MSRELKIHVEHWEARSPFRITGRSWTGFDLVVCELREGGLTGRGEAAGVFYLNENAASILAQIAQVADAIQVGMGREELRDLLPPGGARNALDCALWDLEAKKNGISVWTMAGVSPAAVTTVFTIGLEDSPEAMATKARAAMDRPLLKIKLNADRPLERISAIRAARPDAQLVADVNGGWSFRQLCEWAPAMKELGLMHLEQPLPRGADADLRNYESPLPLLADESCLHLGELDRAVGSYSGIVIKLDKTGGLTEALLLAQEAKKIGLSLMTGCMVATSLSMAPAHVLALFCDFVDIDGPLLLKNDRPGGLRYNGAQVSVPQNGFWGSVAV